MVQGSNMLVKVVCYLGFGAAAVISGFLHISLGTVCCSSAIKHQQNCAGPTVGDVHLAHEHLYLTL